MGDFDLDTRVEGGNGRYQAHISRDWEIWGPNGGYLAAIALRAAGREARIPRPAAFTCHFISVARFEPVQLEVTPVHQGRRAGSIVVAMRQGGRPILQAMLRTAAEGPGLEHDVAVVPNVTHPDTLQSWDEIPPRGPTYPFWQNLEGKVMHSDWLDEEPRAREPVHLEWLRFRPRATFDDIWVDAGRLLLLIDTLSWPAASLAHPWPHQFQGPNLDVTAWFHRFAPESDWLLADHHSPVAQAGLMGTTARIWSRDGRLLASGGAQLLCVPAAPRP
ncbi:MAG: thioesterase family protein [Chloroflexota bacterium]|nr:thioesterase family protein [Chloroflexota bacterium]